MKRHRFFRINWILWKSLVMSACNVIRIISLQAFLRNPFEAWLRQSGLLLIFSDKMLTYVWYHLIHHCSSLTNKEVVGTGKWDEWRALFAKSQFNNDVFRNTCSPTLGFFKKCICEFSDPGRWGECHTDHRNRFYQRSFFISGLST